MLGHYTTGPLLVVVPISRRGIAILPVREELETPAGVPGLEPRLAEPESAGLPITPYPMGEENYTGSRAGPKMRTNLRGSIRQGPGQERDDVGSHNPQRSIKSDAQLPGHSHRGAGDLARS